MKFSPAGLVMTCEEVDMGKGIFMTGRAWLRAICCCANGVSRVGCCGRAGSWGVGVTEGVTLWISAGCGVEQGVLVGVGVEGLGVPDPIEDIQSWGWDINSWFRSTAFLVVDGETLTLHGWESRRGQQTMFHGVFSGERLILCGWRGWALEMAAGGLCTVQVTWIEMKTRCFKCTSNPFRMFHSF